MPVVLVVGTKGKWKGPLGIGLGRKGGPSTVERALGLLRQARRRGLAARVCPMGERVSAAEIMNVLDGWGWQ